MTIQETAIIFDRPHPFGDRVKYSTSISVTEGGKGRFGEVGYTQSESGNVENNYLTIYPVTIALDKGNVGVEVTVPYTHSPSMDITTGCNLKDGYLLGFSSTNDQGLTLGGMAS